MKKIWTEEFENLGKQNPDGQAELVDGARSGLANAANMDFISDMIELIDNITDASGTKVQISFDGENDIIKIASKETFFITKENAIETLFQLGVGRKATTKNKGVGKYNQGFKYSVSDLIGDGYGLVKVNAKPENGEPWALCNRIDYGNTNNYTDKNLYFIDVTETFDEYNFVVEICGAKMPTDYEIRKLMMTIAIRYRDLMNSSGLVIKIENCTIRPQDRLYSEYGKRAGYSGIQEAPYKDNPHAFRFEHSDLSHANFTDAELIDYDTTMGVGGRKEKGVSVTKRSGIELVINGISVIYDGLLEEFIGRQIQPSGASWRGRLYINDNRIVDRYISGGNKSKCVISPDFIRDEATEKIRQIISKAHTEYIEKHKGDKEYITYSIPKLDTWCENMGTGIRFNFIDCDPSRATFVCNEDNNIIEINALSPIFKGGDKDIKAIMIIGLTRNIINCNNVREIRKNLLELENYLTLNDIIN